jgi:enamine deaminase RidA (YjgF/YER057c/UK114 family)
MRARALLPLALLGAACAAPAPSAARHVNLPGRTDTRPFSNAVLVGDTLHLSGALGLDPDTGAPPPAVADEVRFVLDSMVTRLALVGMSMDDLVSVTVFCPDLTLYGEFNSIYRTYFTDGFPARAFIGSGPLLAGARFEVMGTAVRR